MRAERYLDSYGKLPYIGRMAQTHGTARLEARVPAKVHAVLKRAAQIQGRTLTDFVVAAAHDAACRAIAEAEIVHLSIADQRRVASAVLKPPTPTAALRRAARRRRKLLGG
jgi:uncharacterized protein (DUF1778 family)